MLTDKDIDKLMDVFPTKDQVEMIVETKVGELLAPVKDMQERLLTGVDRLATAIETQNLENAARDAQLSRHDGWMRTIAEKTAVSLKD